MKPISSSLLRTASKNGNARALPFILFVAGILAYGAGLAWFMLDRFDFVEMTRWPNNVDDSFYYFEIAKNLADGKFSTFDDGITRTNGYHPLWLLLITPFHWVFDHESVLLAIKAFEIMLIAGCAVLVVLAARICGQPWILLVAVLPSLYLQYGTLLGMETAAALFMLGLLFLALGLHARNPARWRWLLVATAFVLPWARLELVAVSVAATAALAFIEIDRRKVEQERLSDGPSRSLAHHVRLATLLPLFGALAGLLTYFVYNFVVFGGIVPVSGATKMMWSQHQWDIASDYNLVRNAWDILHLRVFNTELLVALEICACLFLVWRFSRRSQERSDRFLLVFMVGVFALAAGHLAQFGQAVLTVHPRWGDTPWHFSSGYLMMALFIPVNLYAIIHFARRFSEPLVRALSLAPKVIAVSALLLVVAVIAYIPYRDIEKRSHHTFQDGQHGWVSSYLVARMANRLLPDTTVMGAWDAGIIGYFSHFPVVQLDALVNSWEYFRTARMEHFSSNVFYMNYGDENPVGITHYTNYRQRNPAEPSTLLYAGTPFPYKGTEMRHWIWAGESTRELSNGHDDGAWFWETMEPHLTYSEGDTGVLLENRIAQILVRDCEPRKMLIFSWVHEGSGTPASTYYRWKNTEKNDLGFCVGIFELPNDAARIRIETVSVDAYAERLLGNLEPVIRSRFDVYLKDDTLVYVRDRCERSDPDTMFFVYTWSENEDGLLGRGGQFRRDFDFGDHGARANGRCIVTFELPGHDIDRIRTGQRIPGEDPLWEGSFDFAARTDDR